MSSNYSRTTHRHTGFNYSIVGAQASKHSSGYGWRQENTTLPASLIRAQSSEISGGGYTRTHEHANLANSSFVRAQASQVSRDQTWRQNEYTRFGSSLASVHTSEFSRDSYGERYMNNSDSTPSLVSARASQFSKATQEYEVVAERKSSRVAASATTERVSRSSRTPARDDQKREDTHASTRTRDEQNEDALSMIEGISHKLGFSGYHG